MRLSVLFLVICVSSATQAQHPIRVASWNGESLGSPYSRDYPRRSRDHGYGVARQPQDVAELFESFRADVIALSEINDNDDDDDTMTNTILSRAFEILNASAGHNWEYELFAKRKRHSGTQLTGIAWNQDQVTPTTRRLRIPVSDTTRDANEWDRHPHAMHFSRGDGRTDFVVIAMHMKAGRGDRDEEQREDEAKALIIEMPEIEAHFSGEQDIVIIGDFNMHDKNEAAGHVFRDGGMFDLNYRDQRTHPVGPLDRCYVPKSQLARGHEFHGVGQVTVIEPTDHSKYRRTLSDHWPIVMQFNELADDD